MLTDYIHTDIIKHILDIYISHHPEDIENLNKATEFTFKSNILEISIYKDIRLARRSYMVDDYIMVQESWGCNDYEEHILLEVKNFKYDKLNGKLYIWNSLGLIQHESGWKNGISHGKHIEYKYEYLWGKPPNPVRAAASDESNHCCVTIKESTYYDGILINYLKKEKYITKKSIEEINLLYMKFDKDGNVFYRINYNKKGKISTENSLEFENHNDKGKITKKLENHNKISRDEIN